MQGKEGPSMMQAPNHSSLEYSPLASNRVQNLRTLHAHCTAFMNEKNSIPLPSNSYAILNLDSPVSGSSPIGDRSRFLVFIEDACIFHDLTVCSFLPFSRPLDKLLILLDLHEIRVCPPLLLGLHDRAAAPREGHGQVRGTGMTTAFFVFASSRATVAPPGPVPTIM